ncbi:GNAT family N-acetyltransferase [Nitratireductor alexandrii]|uniref:GNAT family N-acetyltransferase n=1 Tax=Nitratireductor alexandrii TaxID=2448161 RepID=UPI000FDB873E|nr:GNAT family N-acetyltransferase [Nitratireductor alexandrii]
MTLVVRRLDIAEARARFDELARLRIAVFRDYPYLYEGDAAYERRYLATYFATDQAAVIGAFDGDRLVGAATAAPLAQHFDAFAQPFAERGLDVATFYYFGESVLLKPYRGQGAGVRFFAEREAAARGFGFGACVFSAVVRPEDHPRRPPDYQPLDGFWRKRGYRPIDGLVTEFSWREIGAAAETPKPMAYWMRRL